MTTRDTAGPDDGIDLHADVETYYQNGAWHTRRCDSPEPFNRYATGPYPSRSPAVTARRRLLIGTSSARRRTAAKDQSPAN
ncbi:hypothetical protein [Kribbella sp. NPDC048928]|uniref:hypothetical protein n=1 Tax=Kribbella sp. NPDC048928 TaxID=3364111 RepID=UPI0037187141